MNRKIMHRRVAAALAAALMSAAAAPAADARWFNFDSHGSLVLVTPRAWTSGDGPVGTATRGIALVRDGGALMIAKRSPWPGFYWFLTGSNRFPTSQRDGFGRSNL